MVQHLCTFQTNIVFGAKLYFCTPAAPCRGGLVQPQSSGCHGSCPFCHFWATPAVGWGPPPWTQPSQVLSASAGTGCSSALSPPLEKERGMKRSGDGEKREQRVEGRCVMMMEAGEKNIMKTGIQKKEVKSNQSSIFPAGIYPCPWAYPVCHCWGASAPPGPWGPGPSWAEFPGSQCSLGGAAASPAQRPAAADAAPAASSSAVAAPGETKERTKGAKVRNIIKQTHRC